MLNKLFKGLAVATLMLIGNPTLPQAATIDLGDLGLVAGAGFPNTFDGTLQQIPFVGLSFDNGVPAPFGQSSVSIIQIPFSTDFSLLLSEPDLDVLTGSSTAIESDDNSIEILFNALAVGLVDGYTGGFVLASLVESNGGSLAFDPFDPMNVPPVSATLTLTNVAPIPLPAGIILLLTALGGLVVLRRKH